VNWILLILSSVCFVEIFTRLEAIDRIAELKEIVFKVTHTIASPRISDGWKEKVLPHYALRLFLQSLLIFVLLVGSFSPFFVIAAFGLIFDGQFVKLALSTKGIVTSTLVAISYVMLKSRRPGNDYSAGSKFLHQLVLGHPFVGEATFDLEKLMYASKSPDVATGKHVFVAGLARAGTTILMRKLYENGPYCSLTYRDMPFILAPNLWRVFTNFSPQNKGMQERSHGDGLKVDFDSPETLEEVFWRVFCGSDYIKDESLVPMAANVEITEKFRSFIALILKDHKNNHYLSKNNNNILRLKSITEAFPNAVILVPFREPVQQAYSLLKQHQRFLGIHATDHFSRKYMAWLAHHEFGTDHRPFLFHGKPNGRKDTDNLNYWLELWVHTYLYISENLPSQAILLSYERLCDNTKSVWGRLAEKIDLLPYDKTIRLSKSFHQVKESLPPELLAQATETYNNLLTRSIGFK
jgi:hypothetical protein